MDLGHNNGNIETQLRDTLEKNDQTSDSEVFLKLLTRMQYMSTIVPNLQHQLENANFSAKVDAIILFRKACQRYDASWDGLRGAQIPLASCVKQEQELRQQHESRVASTLQCWKNKGLWLPGAVAKLATGMGIH